MQKIEETNLRTYIRQLYIENKENFLKGMILEMENINDFYKINENIDDDKDNNNLLDINN